MARLRAFIRPLGNVPKKQIQNHERLSPFVSLYVFEPEAPRMNPKLSAALAAAIWGTSYIFITTMLPHNPIFTAAIRALGGGIPLLLLYRQLPQRSWWGKVILLGTLNCGVLFAFLFIAAERLPGGVAGTLQSLGPIFTVLIAWPLLGSRPTPLRLGSIVLGSIGVMVLLSGGSLAFDTVGAIAGIGAALSLALGGVLLNRWGRPAPLLAFTAWQLVVGGIELAVLAIVIGDLPSSLTTVNVIALVYLALIGTTLAYALWFHGIEELGAAAAAPFFLLIPIVAFGLDAAIRGLIPTPLQGLGALVVLGSLLIGQQAGKSKNMTKPAA
jgi:probable blue pigment (indigoidine) exporter